MTEPDARDMVVSIVGSRAIERLESLAALVIAENDRQNLIGRSTISSLWRRHLLDSIQLLRFAPKDWRTWLDIGSGGGFPGLAIGCAVERPIILVEPRSLRADFLRRAASLLRLQHVAIIQSRVEQVRLDADVISARAVAAPERLFTTARSCAAASTTWLLPLGRHRDNPRAIARQQQTMKFHVEQSLSDAESVVLVGVGVPL